MNTDEIDLAILDERERKIIEMRFGLDGKKSKTLQQIGRKLKLTRERIRQLQNIALRKLKFNMENNGCSEL